MEEPAHGNLNKKGHLKKRGRLWSVQYCLKVAEGVQQTSGKRETQQGKSQKKPLPVAQGWKLPEDPPKKLCCCC